MLTLPLIRSETSILEVEGLEARVKSQILPSGIKAKEGKLSSRAKRVHLWRFLCLPSHPDSSSSWQINYQALRPIFKALPLEMCCSCLFIWQAYLNQGTVFSNNPGCQELYGFSWAVNLWLVSPSVGSVGLSPMWGRRDGGGIGTGRFNGHTKGQAGLLIFMPTIQWEEQLASTHHKTFKVKSASQKLEMGKSRLGMGHQWGTNFKWFRSPQSLLEGEHGYFGIPLVHLCLSLLCYE